MQYLINKALIEIPPRFANCPPVHAIEPSVQASLTAKEWRGAQGLAEDVRYYGKWMRDEAEMRIGHLYPKVKLPKEFGSGENTVIAWLWARTVKCPNPACGAMMPLVRSFALSTKKSKQAWVEPLVNKTAKTVEFEVETGNGKAPEGTVNRRGARCIVCGTPVPFEHIRAEGKAGRMSEQLMAIVAEGENGRVYVSPSEAHARVATSVQPAWSPDTDLPEQALGFRVQLYGMTKHRDLFTPRQLVALTTFSDLLGDVHERVSQDAVRAGWANDDVQLHAGGCGAAAFADAVTTYLAFAVDKGANYWSSFCSWHITRDGIVSTFARQALPMVWDFAEANPFSASTGNFMLGIEQAVDSLENAPSPIVGGGFAKQGDAAEIRADTRWLISTDPPYYDNIGYADLSDFFYVWLRHSLSKTYPELFTRCSCLRPKNWSQRRIALVGTRTERASFLKMV